MVCEFVEICWQRPPPPNPGTVIRAYTCWIWASVTLRHNAVQAQVAQLDGEQLGEAKPRGGACMTRRSAETSCKNSVLRRAGMKLAQKIACIFINLPGYSGERRREEDATHAHGDTEKWYGSGRDSGHVCR